MLPRQRRPVGGMRRGVGAGAPTRHECNQCWYNRGFALARLAARTPMRCHALYRSLELEPNNPAAWYERGLILGMAHGRAEGEMEPFDGRHEQAVVAFDRVLALQPDHYGAWYCKAYTLYKISHSWSAIQGLTGIGYAPEVAPQALACVDRALTLRPDNPPGGRPSATPSANDCGISVSDDRTNVLVALRCLAADTEHTSFQADHAALGLQPLERAIQATRPSWKSATRIEPRPAARERNATSGRPAGSRGRTCLSGRRPRTARSPSVAVPRSARPHSGAIDHVPPGE